MDTELSIRVKGFALDTGLVPWDTEVLGYPVAQISYLMIRNLDEATREFEAFHQWVRYHHVKMVSCRLPHESLEASFFLEEMGFRFIEMVLHPVMEELQKIKWPDSPLQVKAVPDNEVALIKGIAEKCFTHERFHMDPRVSSELANVRYGRWVMNSSQSRTQQLLKIEDDNKLVAFFVIEHLQDEGVYWHLTAVAPEFQGRGYGRKAWIAMLGYHQANGIKRVSTTISARNTRVLNLYSQLQFKYLPPDMTFHWMAE